VHHGLLKRCEDLLQSSLFENLSSPYAPEIPSIHSFQMESRLRESADFFFQFGKIEIEPKIKQDRQWAVLFFCAAQVKEADCGRQTARTQRPERDSRNLNRINEFDRSVYPEKPVESMNYARRAVQKQP
jgi:hypothetical protein